MKLSDWQDGVPKEEGVYQILVPEHNTLSSNGMYYARFKGGYWDCGTQSLDYKLSCVHYTHTVFPSNNLPSSPRKWRGIIDE